MSDCYDKRHELARGVLELVPGRLDRALLGEVRADLGGQDAIK